MKFSITGADKDTGETIEMTVDAADAKAAQEVAHRRGIIVSGVALLAVHSPQPPAQVSAVPVQQPLEQGHFRGAPVVNIAPPRRGNSLGIASLVLGILAFLICWIPLVNLLGVPLAALGLLLGLIGLLVAFTRKGASIGFPIAGSAVCGLALFIAISITGALAGGLKKASEDMLAESKRRNATNQTAVAEPAPRKETAPAAPPASDPKPDSVAATLTPLVEPPPANPTTPAIEWASAENPVRQGDVQLKVTAVKVGQVPLKETIGDGEGRSKDTLLSIHIEITNLSETKKLDYRTWGGRAISFRSRMSLTDNFDNSYKVINFGFGSKVKGAVELESVYPGKAVGDVLVFEEPIGKVEHLNLELPAEQFGGTGMMRIRIPASMIQK
jgi:hypothetical protein